MEVEGARQIEEGRPVGDEEVGPGLAPDDAGGDGAEGGRRLGEQAVGRQQDVVLEYRFEFAILMSTSFFAQF